MDQQEISTSHLFWKQNTDILKQKVDKVGHRGPIYYCGLHEKIMKELLGRLKLY